MGTNEVESSILNTPPPRSAKVQPSISQTEARYQGSLPTILCKITSPFHAFIRWQLLHLPGAKSSLFAAAAKKSPTHGFAPQRPQQFTHAEQRWLHSLFQAVRSYFTMVYGSEKPFRTQLCPAFCLSHCAALQLLLAVLAVCNAGQSIKT